jgi:hypothetical protein
MIVLFHKSGLFGNSKLVLARFLYATERKTQNFKIQLSSVCSLPSPDTPHLELDPTKEPKKEYVRTWDSEPTLCSGRH